MKIAFYKASGTLFDKLIRFWTSGPYSHCELVFSNGTWFSSSPRDGGCRWKIIGEDYSKWDFIDIDITEDQENTLKAFCQREDGKGYDWLWIFLTQFLPLNLQDRNKWGCSELVTAALQVIGLLTGVRALSVHPNKLWKLLRSK